MVGLNNIANKLTANINVTLVARWPFNIEFEFAKQFYPNIELDTLDQCSCDMFPKTCQNGWFEQNFHKLTANISVTLVPRWLFNIEFEFEKQFYPNIELTLYVLGMLDQGSCDIGKTLVLTQKWLTRHVEMVGLNDIVNKLTANISVTLVGPSNIEFAFIPILG